MIIGHGIDLQEIAPIKATYQKNPRFAAKVLTAKELELFSSLKGKKQIEFLAGRWSAKEAFSKALGTGIGPVTFQDMEILRDKRGAPYVSKSPVPAKIWLSISHSGNFVQASVILEEDNESKSS
ncbi:holo-ACP synthase [Streptococcus sp. X16XC17]|uniref:holo-ACP synthase n=1 Tax=unclassified Streptococcus TaxID=2608887 RepID=UPI00066FD234|nr:MULTISPECIES: holo-ACP synthase [unclassified Streptococcus]TCD45903.1 holo-ACP synthase [Streptococcus sp. X16XC17]